MSSRDVVWDVYSKEGDRHTGRVCRVFSGKHLCDVAVCKHVCCTIQHLSC